MTSQSVIFLALSTLACRSWCAHLCNETVSSSGTTASLSVLTSPELRARLEGSPMTCVVRIRSAPQDRAAARVVRITFHRLKVGEVKVPSGETSQHRGPTCAKGSYMIIRDGVEKAKGNSHGRRGEGEAAAGRFCGEAEQIRTYYAENPDVDVVIHTDHLDDRLEYEFDVDWVERRRLPARFGARPDLTPHARGNLVANTFCERVFQDCSRTQPCLVQSPGFPGVYPRGLDCRYYLRTREPFIKLYVDRVTIPSSSSSVAEDDDDFRPVPRLFDVGGQDCDSIYSCPYRPLSSNCSGRDYVRIYDGVDEFSPLIGTFCGLGRLPSSVVGTGAQLFVEFHSEREGAFRSTGFDLRIGHRPGNIHPYTVAKTDGDEKEAGCQYTFTSQALEEAGDGEGIFLSPEHWYPPGTNCTFRMLGRPWEIVRLYFPSFRVKRIRDPLDPDAPGHCRETLSLYDANWIHGPKVIRTWCDGFSRPAERRDFVSSGGALTVNFLSFTGSYSGSSLEWWAQYDFFDGRRDGQAVQGTVCDEVFTPEVKARRFRSPRNTLVFKVDDEEKDDGEDDHPAVQCRYEMAASDREFGRVALTLEQVRFKAPMGFEEKDKTNVGCGEKSRLDHLEVLDPWGDRIKACVTSENQKRYSKELLPLTFYSRGPRLTLTLRVPDARSSTVNYFKSKDPLFKASLAFVHPPRECGPAAIAFSSSDAAKSVSNSLNYPLPNKGQFYTSERQKREAVSCVWDMAVSRSHASVLFSVANFTFESTKRKGSEDCDFASLEIVLPGKEDADKEEIFFKQCARTENGDKRGRSKKIPLLRTKKLNSSSRVVRIRFKLRDKASKGSFQLTWSRD